MVAKGQPLQEPKKIDLSPFLDQAIAVYKSMARLSRKKKDRAADDKMRKINYKIEQIAEAIGVAQGIDRKKPDAGNILYKNREMLRQHALKTLGASVIGEIRAWNERVY